MKRSKTFWAWLAAGCALLLVLSCGYPTGIAVRQAVEGPVLPGQSEPADDAFVEISEGVEVPASATTATSANNVTMTLLSVERTSELNGSTAEADQEFVVVDVRIENGSADAITSGMIPFGLADNTGTSYTNIPLETEDALSPNTLEPGEQTQGTIAFGPVPTTAGGLTLTYQPFEFVAQAIDPLSVPLGQVGSGGTAGGSGARAEVEGVALTIVGVERGVELDNQTPGPDSEIVTVELLLENNSEQDVVITEMSFKISQADGDAYTLLATSGSEYIGWDSLSPGEQVQGKLAYSTYIDDTSSPVVSTVPEMSQNLPDITVALDASPSVTAQPEGSEPPTDPQPETAPPPTGGTGAVIVGGGNIRSEPRIAPETVLGQVCPNDQVEVIEQQGGWRRILVTTPAVDCVANHVDAGTEGWVSQELISITSPTAPAPPEPAPAEEAPVPAGDEGSTGVINNGGNFRSAPSLTASSVLGQICPGDSVSVLQQQQAEGILWYQVEVTTLAADCHPERVAAGTQGWLSSVLVDLR